MHTTRYRALHNISGHCLVRSIFRTMLSDRLCIQWVTPPGIYTSVSLWCHPLSWRQVGSAPRTPMPLQGRMWWLNWYLWITIISLSAVILKVRWVGALRLLGGVLFLLCKCLDYNSVYIIKYSLHLPVAAEYLCFQFQFIIFITYSYFVCFLCLQYLPS